MIIHLSRFIQEERPFWTELETELERLEKMPGYSMNLDQIKRFHYLYQRASADLAKISTFYSEQKLLLYLESLVGSAYGEIHESREKRRRLKPLRWFFNTFPSTVRRHISALWLAVVIFFAGCAFGAFAIVMDPTSKEVLLPFGHLQGDPSERVAKEEQADKDSLSGSKATFSSWLMTHNIKVSLFSMALGMTWGVGTVLILFGNGVILGAVAADYISAGHLKFLAGWLLPHGSVEIPAFIIASQAGLILARSVIGWDTVSVSLKGRLRITSTDIVTLIVGVAVMLVWAGIIESFFSQYHEPVIPYEFKIIFGLMEFVLLLGFFWKSGAKNWVKPT